jgi:hypothetical protein
MRSEVLVTTMGMWATAGPLRRLCYLSRLGPSLAAWLNWPKIGHGMVAVAWLE